MCYQFLKPSGDIKDPTGNFTFARGICQSEGAELASVHSAKQNSWFFSHLGGMGYWLGSNKIKGKTPNTWLDGTQFDFVNWKKNEPRSEYDGDGDCMKYRMNEDMGAGLWLARECEMSLKPICQKPAIKGKNITSTC